MSVLIFFSFLAAVILVPRYLKYRERAKLLEVMKAAYEHGQPAPSELVDKIMHGADPEVMVNPAAVPPARKPVHDRDLRRGAVLLAVALALATLGLALSATADSSDATWPLLGVAAFPGFLGLTSLALWWIGRPKQA